MIYELKQKIRHSKWGETFVNKVEYTPVFSVAFWLLCALNLQESQFGQTKADGKKYFSGKKKEIEQIVAALADEKSKQLFLTSIKKRQSGFWYMEGTPHDQYFPKDIIHLSSEEVFVNCGAFTGDTIARFLQETNGQYKKIVAFEPDPLAYKKIENQQIERLHLYTCGVWHKKDTLRFYVNGKGGAVIEKVANGNKDLVKNKQLLTIELEKIDDVAQCSDMTFLKMDLEGSELNALKGAEKTIRKQRPKMAICIYHSNQDMLEIPLWVMSLNMGYKLYVRHHGETSLGETVLYAV